MDVILNTDTAFTYILYVCHLLDICTKHKIIYTLYIL